MAKLFAIVNGLNKIFDTSINTIIDIKSGTPITLIVYDTTHLKEDIIGSMDVNENTTFYIQTDSFDKLINYNGSYIYTHNELFSNFDNKGGQYIQLNLNASLENTGYIFGKIKPNQNSLWTLSYHILAYSDNTTYNSEYDVWLYGYNNIILSYYAFNANGENKPYTYHLIKHDDNYVYIGLGLVPLNNVFRGLSYIINYYLNCQFENIESYEISTLSLCICIDALTNGFVLEQHDISFIPLGTVSTPDFYGTPATISVSGQVSGVNSSSAVTIEASTTSINSVTSTGSLANMTYNIDSESAIFDRGSLPEISSVSVWTGYTSAIAEAQVFIGSTVTLSGTYTPNGTVSAPIFTGSTTTISI